MACNFQAIFFLLKMKLDNKKISLLGWTPMHSLTDGVTLAIKWFKENFDYNNI